MYVKSYKELIVWQKAILLVKEVYLVTESFPNSERYGLTSQIRRSAVSIPSNIAEGYGRRSSKEYSHFYAIAYGSSLELETQLYIARELGYISAEKYEEVSLLLTEVLKMLNKMSTKNYS